LAHTAFTRSSVANSPPPCHYLKIEI
jgi:hypothetical protein